MLHRWIESLETDSAVKKKRKKERIKGEEKSEKSLMAPSTSFHLKIIRLLELSNWQLYPLITFNTIFRKI